MPQAECLGLVVLMDDDVEFLAARGLRRPGPSTMS
jgi:hypothetical protein